MTKTRILDRKTAYVLGAVLIYFTITRNSIIDGYGELSYGAIIVWIILTFVSGEFIKIGYDT